MSTFLSSPRVCGVIIARMDSQRLPGKVLADLGGLSILDWICRRVSLAGCISEIAIATTGRSVDEPIVEFGKRVGLTVFKGDCENVVERVFGCAKAIRADWVFRLNGDSPFPDPLLLNSAVNQLYKLDFKTDLVSNLGNRNFPYGISAELLRTDALPLVAEVSDVGSLEHLTKTFYDRIDLFTVNFFDTTDVSLRNARLVVDTQDDLDRLRSLVALFSSFDQGLNWSVLAENYLRLYPVLPDSK